VAQEQSFELTAAGSLTTLYDFGSVSGCANTTDGETPQGELARDSSGKIYGTTIGGGTGWGTIFRLATDGTLTTLYEFTNGLDGAFPANGVVISQAPSFLFGTTLQGSEGATVFAFKLTP
jgi:uncharacterized repeat protein (TIGR03803 family)